MSEQQVVARRVLQGLASVGVQTVFGLPGVHNLAFWRDEGAGLPRIVGVRHEQTAVYAADGLARATGQLGVALTTTGPGAANAAGAFGEAAASGSPVLLIASEISTRLARDGVSRGVLHESRDQAAIFEPLAKAVFRPRTAEDAVRDVGLAVQTALAFPRGPVYVDIPTDVLSMPAPAVQVGTTDRLAPSVASVAELAAEVTAANRIVLWVGGGVVQADATAEVQELAERLQAPVITTYSARGVLPSAHPCAVGMPPHEPEVAELIGEADLLLALGTDFDGMMTRNWSMPTARRLASVNCDPADLDKNYSPDVGVLGDVQLTLQMLLKALGDVDRPPTAVAPELRATVLQRLSTDPRAVQPLEFLDRVRSAASDDTVIVADMAIPGYWMGGYGIFERPRRLQYPVGWGTLGYALPAAVGPATLGDPVLVICGDGGFMFAVGELATLAQEELPVTVLLVDDGGYGMLRYDQSHAGDAHRGVDLARPDFIRLAEAFGIHAAAVAGTGPELEVALRDALASGRPRMVVVDAAMTPPRTTSPRWAE